MKIKIFQLSRILGWTSLGIAAAEIFGRGYVERDLLGIESQPRLMIGLGIREAAAGVVILSQSRPTKTLAAGLWSRVAGDAIDIALLATAAGQTRKPISFAANSLTVLGITAADVFCAMGVQRKLQKNQQQKNYAERRQTGPLPRQPASRHMANRW